MNLAKPAGISQDVLAALLRTAVDKALAATAESRRLSIVQTRDVVSFWSAQPDPLVIA